MVRAREKWSRMTFVVVGICHRMLSSVTLNLFLKITNLKRLYLGNGEGYRKNALCDFY